MTQVNFNFAQLAASGPVALAGEPVTIVPTSRFTQSSGQIVVRKAFSLQLDNKGAGSVTVPATSSEFAYTVSVGGSSAPEAFVRTVSVPESETAVNFSDLPDVDLGTLGPVDNPGSTMRYMLAASLDAAKTLSGQYPDVLVFYPESSAVSNAATQSLEDVVSLRESVSDAVAQVQSLVSSARAGVSDVQSGASQVAANASSVENTKTIVESTAKKVNELAAQVGVDAAKVADAANDAKSDADAKAEAQAETTAATETAAETVAAPTVPATPEVPTVQQGA